MGLVGTFFPTATFESIGGVGAGRFGGGGVIVRLWDGVIPIVFGAGDLLILAREGCFFTPRVGDALRLLDRGFISKLELAVRVVGSSGGG
jgi:hypothetical protein